MIGTTNVIKCDIALDQSCEPGVPAFCGQLPTEPGSLSRFGKLALLGISRRQHAQNSRVCCPGQTFGLLRQQNCLGTVPQGWIKRGRQYPGQADLYSNGSRGNFKGPSILGDRLTRTTCAEEYLGEIRVSLRIIGINLQSLFDMSDCFIRSASR